MLTKVVDFFGHGARYFSCEFRVLVQNLKKRLLVEKTEPTFLQGFTRAIMNRSAKRSGHGEKGPRGCDAAELIPSIRVRGKQFEPPLEQKIYAFHRRALQEERFFFLY